MNVFLNWLLVWGPPATRIGFVGAPLATAISMDLMAVVAILYSYLFVPRDAWGGISMDIFSDLGINIRLGLAGTAMVASEWSAGLFLLSSTTVKLMRRDRWCWEIVGLASSFLGPTALAAQSVLRMSRSHVFYEMLS